MAAINSASKATIYINRRDMRRRGYKRIEAREVKYGFVEHAQFQNAVQIDYIAKGKRNPDVIGPTSRPRLVILDGWGHPDVQDDYEIIDVRPINDTESLITKGHRHSHWNLPEWEEEFDDFLQKYLKESSAVVLADYRNYQIIEKTDSVESQLNDSFEDVGSAQLTTISNEEGVDDAFDNKSIPTEEFYEGTVNQILANEYERNREARQQCINYYGTSCFICNFDFAKTYGEVGKGFIHVHHLRPISEIGQEYKVDPVNDLRPVCPNCHAMIHRRNPPFSIDEIRALLSGLG